MSNFLQADMLRGRKNIVVTRDAKLGEQVLLTDRAAAGVGPEKNTSGLFIEALVVKATNALTAPAGLGVTFTAAGYGTLVDDFSTASGADCHGIVDPDISGNISVGDTFLLFRKGPMNIISSASASVGPLKPANGGKFAAATTETPPQRCGKLMVAATAGDQVRRAYMDFTTP